MILRRGDVDVEMQVKDEKDFSGDEVEISRFTAKISSASNFQANQQWFFEPRPYMTFGERPSMKKRDAQS